MLKEVGASGQISLGKRFAGQLFDMQIAVDGAVTLLPVKVVPVAHVVQEELASYPTAPMVKPASTEAIACQIAEATRDWAAAHAPQIAEYNDWVTQREPYSSRVRRWREQVQAEPEAKTTLATKP